MMNNVCALHIPASEMTIEGHNQKNVKATLFEKEGRKDAGVKLAI